MSDKWFGPRRFGYGVVPINAKGFATLAIYLIAIGLITADAVMASFNAPRAPAMTLVVAGIITGIFLLVVRAKGPPSWRASASTEAE